MSPGNMGQVRMWRSSGQGQGHERRKCRKSPFLQCKTLIGSNSTSITHRAVNFACILWLLTVVDQIVWPPSLSHDRKWPCVTKCMHLWVVGLSLEDILVLTLWYCKAGMGTRRKSSRPRHSPPETRPRHWLHQTETRVCSSRDVIETLKYKFYWLQ